MNRRIIVPVLALMAAGTIAVGAATVSAQTIDESGYLSIVTKIAEKFNLNQDEVRAVFDEEREVHHADMQQKMEDRLTAAVMAGELAEAQKQAILTKHEEMQTQRDANFEAVKNMTAEERRAAMQTKRTELQAWATAQGIDMKYLMMFGKGGHGGPGGFGGRMGEEPAASAEAVAE